jgi:RNA polymerase sigma factor (sigma-70 family)
MNDLKTLEFLRGHNHHKAFVQLYKYRKTFRKYVQSNSGTTEDADDIFQEALLILHRKVNDPSFQLSSSLNTFLFAIAKNLWRDQLKKRKVDVSQIPSLSTNSDIDDLLAQESLFRKAEEALKRITAQCQEILEYFYIRKWSMLAIANQLGLSSENAAKTAKYKCLERARENYITLTQNR